MSLEQQIEKLTNALAQKKMQQLLKENAQKTKAIKLTRKQRDRKIYKLGGMVEKMGLSELDETVFLGVLHQANQALKSGNSDLVVNFKRVGIKYLPIGLKLDPVFLEKADLKIPALLDEKPEEQKTENIENDRWDEIK